MTQSENEVNNGATIPENAPLLGQTENPIEIATNTENTPIVEQTNTQVERANQRSIRHYKIFGAITVIVLTGFIGIVFFTSVSPLSLNEFDYVIAENANEGQNDKNLGVNCDWPDCDCRNSCGTGGIWCKTKETCEPKSNGYKKWCECE